MLFYDDDSSDDEENVVQRGTTVITRSDRIDKVLNAFLSSPGENTTVDLSPIDLKGIRESLEDGLRHRSQTCLICIETLKRNEAIWSCVCCYTVFHLVCIQSWARHGLSESALRSSEDQSCNGTSEQQRWYCPKCRNEYTRGQCPSEYRCFCRQVLNPKSDPWLLPHSCGQTCRRRLAGCDHACLLLCHPGPCPPCPKTIMVSCHCEKMAPSMRRCGQKSWSCGKECGRKLSCGLHSCQDICHADQCEPCDAVSQRSCVCGRHSAKRPCAEGRWHCETVCGRELNCKRHACQTICHDEQCPPCAGSDAGIKCPCGKTVYDETSPVSCIDEVRPCGDTCGKLLDCGFHYCPDRCHRGQCPSCTQLSQKRCRCGLKEKLVTCGKEFLCDVKCKQKRQCGRHPCNRRCCDGQCQPCEQVCGRTLQCGKHKCQTPCHRGLCYPCILTTEVKCRCGETKIKVPCGAEKRTKPPRCRRQCSVPPDCHHERRDAHVCHFGDCPPCQQICSKALKKCGHSCSARCHSAVMVDVNAEAAKRPAASPLEKLQPKFIRMDLPCPPCDHPVPVACIGGHEVGQFPCCQAKLYSCGRACGRALMCGNHKCSKLCHAIDQDSCQECNEACGLQRPRDCTHPCLKQCHLAPCPPCRQMLRKPCHCGLNQMYTQCLEWNSSDETKRRDLLSCGNPCPKQMACGHQCTMICHHGPCSSPNECSKKVTVRCACGRRNGKAICSKVSQSSHKPIECDDECKAQKSQKVKEQEKVEEESTPIEESKESVSLGPRRRRKQKMRSSDDNENGEFLFSFGKRQILVGAAVGAVAVVLALLLWWFS